MRVGVRDAGTGMDEETRAHAVEPFFSTKGLGKGTGLGLSMVHGLAAQLGGALTIDSETGKGTAVTLWLRICHDLPDAEHRPTPSIEHRDGLGIALLGDDEDVVRMSTAHMLSELGYEVVEAASGEAALQLIREGLNPDLLVSDHLMPGMTGAPFVTALHELRPSLPALIISGYAEAEGIDPSVPRITKPSRSSELAACLSELMK